MRDRLSLSRVAQAPNHAMCISTLFRRSPIYSLSACLHQNTLWVSCSSSTVVGKRRSLTATAIRSLRRLPLSVAQRHFWRSIQRSTANRDGCAPVINYTHAFFSPTASTHSLVSMLFLLSDDDTSSLFQKLSRLCLDSACLLHSRNYSRSYVPL